MQGHIACMDANGFDFGGAVTDDVLVALAKAGEHSAYVELCRRHSQMAMRMINRIVRNREDSEDALQESILKAYIHLDGFDGRSKFSTWFAKISINSALMLLRKQNARPMQSFEDLSDGQADSLICLADRSPDPESSAVQMQISWQLQQAISRLPPVLREVTEIRQALDLSVEEVAHHAGLTVAATKSRLLRARKELTIRMGGPAARASRAAAGRRLHRTAAR